MVSSIIQKVCIMKWSNNPIRTLKEAPTGAKITSHILLLRSGCVYPLASGLFTYAPFMVKALQNLETVIRQEMTQKGLIEIYMPMVQPREIWEQTGRWDTFSEILQKMKNRSEQEFCLGPTHEEVVTQYMKNQVKSYRDLPIKVYQIQTKYRDEFRPRFGLLRAREFLMKDGYSFDLTKKDALSTYHQMEEAYQNIFSKLGVRFCSVQADSGAIGGDYSKEFHILAEQGEDTLLISEDGKTAINKEMKTHIETLSDTLQKQLKNQKWKECRGIEVGHIFYLGNKYSKAMDATFLDSKGVKQYMEMGCYGIGLSRTIQAIIEQSHDSNGMVWPYRVAPFLVHVLGINWNASQKVQTQSLQIYQDLKDQGVECFLDDRDEGAGVKFKDADLLGLPIRITVGEKDLSHQEIEVVFRKTGKKEKWPISQVTKRAMAWIQQELH